MNRFSPRVDINNGALKSISAMPQKDSTSDGDSSFEMSRAVYLQTNYIKPTAPVYQNNQKKWLGNRDSSQVTANRRNNSIGKGTINTNSQTPLSFTTYKDVNVVNTALTRCRSGGAVAPPKCAYKKNGMTPTFAPANPTKTSELGYKYKDLKHPVLYH